MSRVIVKNLPKKITETKLKAFFADYGTVTDCSLKYTKDGVFRRFAFVGFASDVEAKTAIGALNNTYMDLSKISVEISKDFTENAKKLVVPPSNSQPEEANKKEKKQNKKKFAADAILEELEDDAEFQEFLSIHGKKADKTWANDDRTTNLESSSKLKPLQKASSSNKNVNKMLQYAFEGESDSSDDEERKASENKNQDEKHAEMKEPEQVVAGGSELAKDKELSDMDYLMKKSGQMSHLSDDEDEDLKAKVEKSKAKHAQATQEKKKTTPTESKYVVKLKGLPPGINRGLIQVFFDGLSYTNIDLPYDDKKKPIGIAFVHFKTREDLDAALRLNRSTIKNKKVTIVEARNKETEAQSQQTNQNESEKPLKTWELKAGLEEDVEPIADSGRLFVRNLAHICSEEDLEQLFSPFGQLTEVTLPIDPVSKRVKGFALIGYMFPEHAVKAFNALDGTTYKGRLMHILPGKPKKEEEIVSSEKGGKEANFQLKKKQTQKQIAQSSHNWNTLFLGANAVAEVMASKYGVDKSQLLDSQAKQSLGVRLALGETEVVNETRDFLISNGVSLDSFSQAAGARSKTVILVKNLPSQTSREELEKLFTPFGAVGRVLLPPSGISALVEFQEPHEAKQAFSKLAYTRFKHLPLYLEWAPQEVFVPKPEVREDDSEKDKTTPNEKSKEEGGDNSSDEEDEDRDTTGCTLFVKNLNFETTDDRLKAHFKPCGTVVTATVASKRDPRNPGKSLSMGYGFVQFRTAAMAQVAIKSLQGSMLDNHSLELKLSERTLQTPSVRQRKKADGTKIQRSTKILVRNIPFQANRNEITELFKVFGELKLVRLPKKVGGQHRGFAFVDFITKNDAKRAFNALCHSTHLYGRRLVLEWADTAEESVDNLRKKTADSYDTGRSSKILKRSDVQESLEKAQVDDD